MKEKLFCKICGKELQGSQRLYCSSSCKQKGHYQYGVDTMKIA